MPSSLHRVLALLFASALAMPLWAQDIPHACAGVGIPSERLACYDRAFPPPPRVREEAAQQAISDFGLQREQGPLRNPGQSAAEADPDTVQGKVAKIDYIAAGKRSITLEGGQRWVMIDASSSGHMQVGESVVLRKGMMGNFLLTTQGGATLRVRRVR